MRQSVQLRLDGVVMGGFLGAPRPEWTVWHCGHKAAPDDELHCNKDGTWHGFAIDGTKIAGHDDQLR